MSVRQCFADLGILAEQDPESIKGSDFKAERVSYIRRYWHISDNMNVSFDAKMVDLSIEDGLVTGQNVNVTANAIILGHQGGSISMLNVSRRRPESLLLDMDLDAFK